MEPSRYETKAEFALRILRERILVGVLLPGQKLDINEIADEFGMSATPVREAMKALQADHLAAYTPHRGTVVADHSEEVTAEVFRLRLLLEPAATAAAIHQMTPGLLRELERRHAQLVAGVDTASDVFAERDSAWHWTLYGAAGSTFLLDFIRRLWDAFPWRALASSRNRREAAIAEHEAMMEAVRRADADAALQQMRGHIEGSQQSLRLAPGPLAPAIEVDAARRFARGEPSRAVGDAERRG